MKTCIWCSRNDSDINFNTSYNGNLPQQDHIYSQSWLRENKVKEDWPPHDDAIVLYEEYTSSTGGVYITGEEGNLVFELKTDNIDLNESSSKNYTVKKGKYQKYKPLKAPFTSGTGTPQGKITRDSFGA